MVTPFCKKDKLPQSLMKLGKRSLEILFPGFTEDSWEQAALSAGQQAVGNERSVDVARPAHLGALIAAKTRILDMSRGAATAGLLPKHPFFSATEHCKAADDSWQTTIQVHNGPTITNPTVPEVEQSLASQHDDDDSEPTFAPEEAVSADHSSKRRSPCCLTVPDCGA